MPALSGPDAAAWRTHPQNYQGSLYLLQPTAVYAARTTYGADPIYPVSGIVTTGATTGAYTDVKEGMLVLVGTSAGADDKGRVWIQSDPTNGTLPIPPCYPGTSDGTVTLTNNLYVTVLKVYLPRPKTPFIDTVSPYTMYKDSNLTVGTNTTTPPPVANAGPWMAGQVNTGTGLLTVAFSSSGSFATASGATISSVLWNVDGGTITVGTTTTTNITATFAAGYYYVKLTVTDSNGKTHTCKTLVIAGDESSHQPIRNFKRTSCRHSPAGQTTAFVVRQSIDMSVYPDGMPLIFVKTESPDLTSYAPTGRETVKFCGWLDKEPTNIQATLAGAIREVTLSVVDAAGKLAQMREFPQIVRAVTSPALWTEATYVNVDQYTHYLLQWHSNILDLVDWQWTTYGYSKYPLIALDSDGTNLFEQVDSIAKSVGYFFSCDPWGRLALVPDEMQLPTVTEVASITGLAGLRSRSTVTTVALNETDWTSPVYTRKRPPVIYWEIGEAIVANATSPLPAFVIGPGAIPGYGESSKTVTRQVVVNSTELQYRIGKLLGIDNADDSLFDIQLAHGVAGEMFAPSINQWVTLEITSATAAQRGETIASTTRFLVRDLEITDNDNALDQVVKVRLERETFGAPVQVEVRPDNEANLPSYDNPFDAFPEPDPIDGGIDAYMLYRGTGTIAIFTEDGYLLRTSDFQTPSAQGGPTWVAVTLSDQAHVFTPDAFSPRYLQTGPSVNGWYASNNGLVRLTDIFGGTTESLQHTFASAVPPRPPESSFIDMDFSFGTPGWGICIIYYFNTNGTVAVYTTNGATWTEVTVTPHYQSFGTLEFPGIFVSSKVPGLAYTSAFIDTAFTNPDAKIFRTTTYGAAWAQVASPAAFTPGQQLVTSILPPYADNTDTGIIYFSGFDSGSGTHYLRRKNADGSVSTITPPLIGGYAYTPVWGQRSFHACPIDRLSLAMLGSSIQAGKTGLFTSRDGGDNWTVAQEPVLGGSWPYYGLSIAGNDRDVIYLWGGNGQPTSVGYSQDFGLTIDDRTGNIPALGVTGIVGGICGG